MKESVLSFGNDLVGVVCQPERPDPARPLVLIPNTGIEHRVGPKRLHVRLARALAESGYASARLDMSGLGDSPAAADANSIAELRSALDTLQLRRLGRRFVALGLCSGAHDAYRLALADERIAGLALLDGYAYVTPRFIATYVWQRASDPERWLAYAQKLLRKREINDMDTQLVDYFRQPGAEQFRDDLQKLRKRGVGLCFVYSGQMQYIYNYACQLSDRFPELRSYAGFELHHMPHADHTFSSTAMGAQLVERLITWLRRSGETAQAMAAANDAVATQALPQDAAAIGPLSSLVRAGD